MDIEFICKLTRQILYNEKYSDMQEQDKSQFKDKVNLLVVNLSEYLQMKNSEVKFSNLEKELK